METYVESKGVLLKGTPVYLDTQATTPLDPRVLDHMLPFMTDLYGNPHSRTHLFGWETEDAVEVARGQVASLIGANAKEIIFTSGATDHKCVLDSCRVLQQRGFDVTYLPVKSNGLLDLDELKAAIRDDTVLVSVMAVNNEIGVIQPLKDIGAICRERGVFFHTDAAQAVGKIPIDVNECNIDLLSISGHKLYGPKGVGAIYIRRRPRVRLEAQINGGGQERGIRSGTVPSFLVAGLGKACEVAAQEMENDRRHVERLAKKLYDGVTSKLEGVVLNGDHEHRYWGNCNLSFAYVEGESLLMGLKDLAVSSGSACTSASLEPSYVLRALGVEDELAHTSIRFGIGRFTTDAEVDRAINQTVKHVEKLREMSPLWEMVQEGVDLSKIQWAGGH